jgi:autotransporter family porin
MKGTQLRRTALHAVVLALVVLGSVASGHSPVRADVASTTPDRVLDTRSGVGAPPERLRPGRVLRLALDDVDVSGETAVMLNVTATGSSGPGYVSAWSCDDDAPLTSVLNVDAGHATANGIILPYTAAGLCFSSSVALHLIADLTGVATDGDVRVGRSHRLHDSRDQGAPHRAGRTYRLPVAGEAGIPDQAAAALLNVTVARPANDGWLIVEACGAGSDASTMNFRAGEAVPHFTVSSLAGGDVCITSSADAHVIVDTFGWTAGSSVFQASTPSRLLDTRDGMGGTLGRVRDGDVIRLRVAGRPGVPNDADGAIVNVVAVRPDASGYVSVHPCSSSGTATSTVNLWPGVLRANQAVLTLPASGELCLTTDMMAGGSVHLVLDAVGFLEGNVSRTPPPPPTEPPPSGAPFTTLPVGAALPSGAECAARVRTASEVRPENAAPNANAGSRANANTRTDWPGFARVDGAFSGTTDEIIQWAACKWGIDEDIARAQVIKESYWYMSANGDNGESWGLGQVRDTAHPSAFQYPAVNARNSSAYNLDYTYASWRACYEGAYTWLNDVERNGTYGAGDVWGCLGVWFSGRWYVNTDAYLNRPGDSVRYHYENRTWETSSFRNG